MTNVRNLMKPKRTTWHDDAKCAGKPAESYYVEHLNPQIKDLQAKALCAGCPVIKECHREAKQSFSISDLLGLAEVDSTLETVGVVRAGRCW